MPSSTVDVAPAASPSPDPVVLATDAADAAAVAAVRAHHAELAGALQTLVAGTVAAAASGRADADARQRLVAFLTGELLPHALAEEATLYPAASALPPARLLVEAMVAEHRVLQRLVGEVAQAPTAVAAAVAASALAAVFEVHLDKENEVLLPLVAADPGVSLATLLGGMHELLGGEGEGTASGCGGGGACGCGERDSGVPELDARTIPHAIRHATVFGAFDAVGPGGSLDLVAPHDPVPLLRQLADRAGGSLGVEYLERGPEAWRVRLTRP